jgi:hypothetical protein
VLCVEFAEVFQAFVEIHHYTTKMLSRVLSKRMITIARICVQHGDIASR